MKCADPKPWGPCRQCMQCRINKSREWSHRIMLEAASHKHNSFVTLTYENNPVSLQPKHLQDFIKRLRRRLDEFDTKIRFFAVGEYGDETERPHYHLALFGYSSCANLRTLPHSCCFSCNLIKETWKHGLIDQGQLTPASAQYIAGYVTKKMTNPNNLRVREWLNGRHPEFMRCSQGIAHDAAKKIADSLVDAELEEAQLTSTLNYNGKSLYLGRYMKAKIQKYTNKEEITNELRLQAQEKTFNETLEKLNQSTLSTSDFAKREKAIYAQEVLNQSKKLAMREKKGKTL